MGGQKLLLRRCPSQQYKCEFFFHSAQQPVLLRCHYAPALSQCDSWHTKQKRDFWEQTSSRWLLTCFLSTNTKAQMSTGPGRHFQQRMAVSFRSLGRLQKRFLKKAELTLWNGNPGAYLQGGTKSQASESGCCFSLWGPGPAFHLSGSQLPPLKQ